MKALKMNTELYNEIKTGMNLVEEEEYLNIMRAISKLASDTVRRTIGPFAHTTVLNDGVFTYPSKDGWSAINRLHFGDPIYNTLFELFKNIPFNLLSTVGDGTSTAMVAANHFLELLSERSDVLGAFRQRDFVNALTAAKESITAAIKSPEYCHYIDRDGDFSDIRKIAYVSTNENDAVSDIIQKIYQETKNPNIYVTLKGGKTTEMEIETGYKLDCHPINMKAYVNTDEGHCRKVKPVKVIIFDHTVTYSDHGEVITMLSRLADSTNSEIIIFAPHFDDLITSIVGSSIDKMLSSGCTPNVMLVQISLGVTIQKKFAADFMMLTGAQVFNSGMLRVMNIMLEKQLNPKSDIDDALLKIDQYQFDSVNDLLETCIGTANRMTLTKSYCILYDYDKEKPIFINTMKEVHEECEKAKKIADKRGLIIDKEYNDAYKRYSRLCGNLGTINVGEESELAKHCLKDSIDDAVLACKSAYDHGYVVGLNITTLRVIHDMMSNTEFKSDIALSVLHLLDEVFHRTSLDVMRNKFDTEGETTWAGNLTDVQVIDECIRGNKGYNIVSEEFETENHTVINSVQTDIEVINAIVGILSLLLTSNQFISVNRMYDRRAGKKALLADRVNDYKAIAKGIADVLVDAGIVSQFTALQCCEGIGGLAAAGVLSEFDSIDEEDILHKNEVETAISKGMAHDPQYEIEVDATAENKEETLCGRPKDCGRLKEYGTRKPISFFGRHK